MTVSNNHQQVLDLKIGFICIIASKSELGTLLLFKNLYIMNNAIFACFIKLILLGVDYVNRVAPETACFYSAIGLEVTL